jgi:endonuclease-3
MAVDTHIFFRMGNRTGLAPGKTPLAVELKKCSNASRPSTCGRAPHILHARSPARTALLNVPRVPDYRPKTQLSKSIATQTIRNWADSAIQVDFSNLVH